MSIITAPARAASTTTTSRWPLVLLRVVLGLMFMFAAQAKLGGLEAWPDRMVGFLTAQQNMPGFYRAFVDAVLIPGAPILAPMVAVGELLVGISLVAGLATPVGAVGGLWLTLNFMLAKGAFLPTPTNNDLLFILGLLVVLFMHAGRTAGVDGFLRPRLRSWPF